MAIPSPAIFQPLRSISRSPFVRKLDVTGIAVPMLLAIAAAGLANAQDDASEALARKAGEGWRANRESFTQFTCRYRVIQGIADSREAAMRGEVVDRKDASVLWAVDGERERCSIDAAEQARIQFNSNTDGQGSAVGKVTGIVSKDYLGLGQIRLHSSGMAGGGSLYGPEFTQADGGNEIATPFEMGVMGPGGTMNPPYWLEFWLKAGEPVQIDATEADAQTVTVRREKHDGTPALMEFDPHRGYLTKRIFAAFDQAGTRYIEAIITDMKEAARGQWFPMRSVRLDSIPGDGQTRFKVRILEVTELKMGVPTDPSVFAIQLPAKAYINDASDARSQFVLEEPIAITPEDLPQLLDKAKGRVKQKETYEVAKAAAQQPQRGWLTWTTVAVIALSGGFVLVRKLRHAA